MGDAGLRSGMLVFPDLTQLDLTGPYEILARVPGAETLLIWKTLEPVRSEFGLTILPMATFESCGPLDLVMVPGGAGMNPLLEDDEVLAFLRRTAAAARYVVGICTGSLVLGAAGLLRGKRASTHWMSHDLLAQFGAIPVRERVVVDGNVFTGGGVTAGIDVAGVGRGCDALDLCCGPGVAAAAAAARGAVACGLDFSPAMLAQARASNPDLRFHQGDAEAVPLPDASFDAIVSNFGIHHVPRPERALTEALRVLRPGGVLAFTTWAAPTHNIAWQLLFDAIRLHGDIDAASSPPSGGGLGEAATVKRLLRDIGFAEASAKILR